MKMTLTTSVKETCLLTLGKTSTWWNKGRESPRYCRVLWVGLKGGKEMKTVSPFSGTFLWVLKTKQEQNAHEKYLRLDSNKENLARLWKFSWKLSVNSLYSICLHSFHVWTNSPLFGVFLLFILFCFLMPCFINTTQKLLPNYMAFDCCLDAEKKVIGQIQTPKMFTCNSAFCFYFDSIFKSHLRCLLCVVCWKRYTVFYRSWW